MANAFKLKPLAEILRMAKEAVNAGLAPVRAARLKAQAQLEVAKIDEQMASKEAEVQEMCSKPEIDFPKLIDVLDQAGVLERRKHQYTAILSELFPE